MLVSKVIISQSCGFYVRLVVQGNNAQGVDHIGHSLCRLEILDRFFRVSQLSIGVESHIFRLLVGQVIKSCDSSLNKRLVRESDLTCGGQGVDLVHNSLGSLAVSDDRLGGFELVQRFLCNKRLLIISQRFISVSCRLNVFFV